MSAPAIQQLYQTLCNLIEIIRQHGAFNVVLSPGSRSAPLALSFIRNGKFDVYHVVDERSAAYFALGLAKASKRPSVLVCTSGTAALNYAPAVAEAYFQQIPLLVLTSDRPPEWIGQNDNQAIYQKDLYGKHVKSFTQMPVSFVEESNRAFAIHKINEACVQLSSRKAGPVHVNFPFREPFYNTEPSPVEINDEFRLVTTEEPALAINPVLLTDFASEIVKSKNIWLLVGTCNDVPEEQALNDFIRFSGASVFIDPLCNLHLHNQLYRYDNWLDDAIAPPDLVLSFGNHFLSKKLKLFLRKHKPKHHIHIQPYAGLADPFNSITFLLKAKPGNAIQNLNELLRQNPDAVVDQEHQAHDEAARADEEADMELRAAMSLFKAIPDGSVIHFGNSTPVRYLLRWSHLLREKDITVYANRGTSGIDGSVSTAVGMAQNGDRPHFLIIGDLSMYYDRNGLWNQYVPDNFRIIVMNNGGGGIFKRIEGPLRQAELEEYFVNEQHCDFEALAKAHRFGYETLSLDSADEWQLTGGGKVLYEVKL